MRSSDFVFTHMITDRTGLHSVLLPLLICKSGFSEKDYLKSFVYQVFLIEHVLEIALHV